MYEQFLIPIGNIVETDAIAIHFPEKYMTSHIDHLNQHLRNKGNCSSKWSLLIANIDVHKKQ